MSEVAEFGQMASVVFVGYCLGVATHYGVTALYRRWRKK